MRDQMDFCIIPSFKWIANFNSAFSTWCALDLFILAFGELSRYSTFVSWFIIPKSKTASFHFCLMSNFLIPFCSSTNDRNKWAFQQATRCRSRIYWRSSWLRWVLHSPPYLFPLHSVFFFTDRKLHIILQHPEMDFSRAKIN